MRKRVVRRLKIRIVAVRLALIIREAELIGLRPRTGTRHGGRLRRATRAGLVVLTVGFWFHVPNSWKKKSPQGLGAFFADVSLTTTALHSPKPQYPARKDEYANKANEANQCAIFEGHFVIPDKTS